LALLYLPLPGWIVAALPFLSVVISLAVYLLPGMAVAICHQPEENWIERLPLAMILTGVALSLPGFSVLIGQRTMAHFLWSFVGITAVTVLVAVVVTVRRSRQGTAVRPASGTAPGHSLLAFGRLPGRGRIAYLCHPPQDAADRQRLGRDDLVLAFSHGGPDPPHLPVPRH
jgi:hypothetical protein